MKNRMTTSDEAVPAKGQHTKPCFDCPMRRSAIPGWLGGETPEDYARLVMSDTIVDCHVLIGAQCAGIGIYRANVCKTSRYPEAIRLPSDRINVFGNQQEFLNHHTLDKKR